MSHVRFWSGLATSLAGVFVLSAMSLAAEGGRGQGQRGGAAGGNLFERFDKNKDGKLSKDEIPPFLAERLAQIDTDKDGAISKSEWEAAREKIMQGRGGAGPGGRPNPPPVDEVFQRLDKNGDGKLTKDEIPGQMGERLARADANGDGVITKAELEEARKKMAEAGGPGPGRGGMDPDQMFERLDKNKDGKLTKDELPERMAEFLMRADTNKDGALTKEELKEARKKFEEMRKAKAGAKQ